jgi:hypothetical protein
MADFEPFMRSALIAQAEAFAALNGLSLGYVSRCAFLDARFIEKLKSGDGSFTARKFDEAMHYFGEKWPQGRYRPPVPRVIMQAGNRKPQTRRNSGAKNGKGKSKGTKARRR